MGGPGSGSLMRSQVRYWPRLQTSEGLTWAKESLSSFTWWWEDCFGFPQAAGEASVPAHVNFSREPFMTRRLALYTESDPRESERDRICLCTTEIPKFALSSLTSPFYSKKQVTKGSPHLSRGKSGPSLEG